MTPDRHIVFVVPADIDDPTRSTGGNEYDRQLIAGLRGSGWTVDIRPVGGPWTNRVAGPAVDPDLVAHAVADLADGTVVLVDGMFAASAAGTLAACAARLRLVLLMHMSMSVAPPGHGYVGASAAERSVLGVAAAVIASSDWLRQQIIARQLVDPERVSVVPPGVERAQRAVPSTSGNRLLCVAPVAPHKGHDVLVDALGRLSDVAWICRCVGSLDRDPGFAASIRAAAAEHGIDDRIVFAGARSRSELADDYAASDLLVMPTRSESYGMVLTEALARGLPVVVSDVGGVVEAMTGQPPASGTGAAFPGALIPPDDPGGLADQLRLWLTDAGIRAEWRRRAGQRRLQLHDWPKTARQVALAIERATAQRVT